MRDAMIVDYAYYKDVYGGELNEQDFRKQEQKAEAYVNAITFGAFTLHFLMQLCNR